MLLYCIPRKCTGSYTFTESKEKIDHLMYTDDTKLFAKKWKTVCDSDTNNNNIQSRYRNGIWHRKMGHTDNENGKRQITKGIERANQRGKNPHSLVGGLTPLQRCSQCILHPQLTGQGWNLKYLYKNRRNFWRSWHHLHSKFWLLIIRNHRSLMAD